MNISHIVFDVLLFFFKVWFLLFPIINLINQAHVPCTFLKNSVPHPPSPIDLSPPNHSPQFYVSPEWGPPVGEHIVFVTMSVFLSAVLSRLCDYSSQRFKILYSDSTYIEDVQHRSFDKKLKIVIIIGVLVHFRLNMHFCPVCFSKTIHRIVFFFSKYI